jgi:hypothetical protein
MERDCRPNESEVKTLIAVFEANERQIIPVSRTIAQNELGLNARPSLPRIGSSTKNGLRKCRGLSITSRAGGQCWGGKGRERSGSSGGGNIC